MLGPLGRQAPAPGDGNRGTAKRCLSARNGSVRARARQPVSALGHPCRRRAGRAQAPRALGALKSGCWGAGEGRPGARGMHGASQPDECAQDLDRRAASGWRSVRDCRRLQPASRHPRRLGVEHRSRPRTVPSSCRPRAGGRTATRGSPISSTTSCSADPKAQSAGPDRFARNRATGRTPITARSPLQSDGPPGSVTTRFALEGMDDGFCANDQRSDRGKHRTAPRGELWLVRHAGRMRHGLEKTVRRVCPTSSRRGPSASRASADGGGTHWNLWGAGTTGSMSTGEHDARGRVRSATVGADVERGSATLGLALSHSTGRGSTTPTGPVEADLSSVAPYVGSHQAGCTAVGHDRQGHGDAALRARAGRPIRTGIETTLAAAGIRVAIGDAYRVQWSTRASAAVTAIETGEIVDLDPIDSRSGRRAYRGGRLAAVRVVRRCDVHAECRGRSSQGRW